MNVTEIEKHTFAYIALFIGAGMFVLWKPLYSISIVFLSFVANIIFFHFNSSLALGEILINGAMLTASVAVFTILLIHTRTNLTKKEIISRLALAETNKQLAVQKNINEEKNKDVQDSIRYALRIQRAILPHNDKMDKVFDDYFIFYQPKDIIAGDFYWLEKVRIHSGDIEVVNTTTKESEHLVTEKELVVFAAADCTGHGVPGAMVSVVCSNALNRAAKEFEISDPGKLLDKARELVIESFENSESKVLDGMDISLCVLNKETRMLQWAGANNPLWIIRDGNVISYKPDKQPIGFYADMTPFTTHNIELKKGDCLYMFTDGYQDQFGGKSSKKFKASALQQTLLSINHLDMKTQKKELHRIFEDWKGDLSQVDDVCVMGFRM
jgi:serine phosphatase RsbU (regulator of sigma subunit)